MPRISHGLSDRFCQRSELRQTSLQPGSVLPTPAVSCNCRWGSGVPAQDLEAWISQLSQVNGHLHDLGVCKWRRLREGAQPGKAEVRALLIAARKSPLFGAGADPLRILGEEGVPWARLHIMTFAHFSHPSKVPCQPGRQSAKPHRSYCSAGLGRLIDVTVPSKASEASGLCQVTPSRYLMSAVSFGNLPQSQGGSCGWTIVCKVRYRLRACRVAPVAFRTLLRCT